MPEDGSSSDVQKGRLWQRIPQYAERRKLKARLHCETSGRAGLLRFPDAHRRLPGWLLFWEDH
jgi:hypothetical protein